MLISLLFQILFVGGSNQNLFDDQKLILMVVLGLLALLLLLNIMLFVYFAMSISRLRQNVIGEPLGKIVKISDVKRHSYRNYTYDASFGEDRELEMMDK